MPNVFITLSRALSFNRPLKKWSSNVLWPLISKTRSTLKVDLPYLQQLHASEVVHDVQLTPQGMTWRATLREIPQMALRFPGKGVAVFDHFQQELELVRRAQDHLSSAKCPPMCGALKVAMLLQSMHLKTLFLSRKSKAVTFPA